MIFNGIEKDYLTVTRGRRRPAWAPIHREFINVRGMAGAYLSETKTSIRQIDVPVFLLAENFSDLQKVKEDLAEWLIHDDAKELIFKDEPDRVYYAVVDNELFLDELVRWGEGFITFICHDPYKYGPEKTETIDSDTDIIVNNGTAPTKPVFTFTVTQPTTMIEYTNGDDYMAIGRPESVESVPYQPLTPILIDELKTTVGWGQSFIPLDLGSRTGDMISFGEDFGAENYGVGPAWHGPAVQKTFNGLQDYKVQVHFNVRTLDSRQRGRAEAYLISTDLSVIGKIIVTCPDTSRKADVSIYLKNGTRTTYILHQKDAYQDGFHGYVTLEKKGVEFKMEVGTDGWDRNLKYEVYSRNSFTFNDLNSDFQQSLAGVVLHVGMWADSHKPYRARIRGVKIHRINEEQGIPYIAEVEDEVVIDHKNELITINGEIRTDLKDFGGNYFELKPGQNLLTFNPSDSFDAEVTFREKNR